MKTLPFTIRNERQFIALTGVSQEVFDILLLEFTKCLDLSRKLQDRKRQIPRSRKPGGGRKGSLSTPEQKLFFTLFYLKNYPTYDVLGALFDLSSTKAGENINKLLPILKNAQQHLHVLPHRHLDSRSNIAQNAKNVTKIIIDATEKPVCRPPSCSKTKTLLQRYKDAVIP
ncbi:hypothetical protein CCP3SC1_50009 [Gammaproteobacteria bacterium]